MYSLLAKYGIDFTREGKHNSNLGWVSVNCPCCGDKNYHGGFNTKNGAYHCFKCEAKGGSNIFTRLTGISYQEAKLEYSGGFPHKNPQVKSKPIINEDVKDVVLPGAPYYLKTDKRYKEYLEERRVPYQDNDWRRLQATSKTEGKYANRIVIPIYVKNRLVSWQTRSIFADIKTKYMSAPTNESIISIKNVLYGQYPQRDVIGIVEGVFDCWALGDKFVCIFGCTLSDHQFSLLTEKQRVFFCFDSNDENAQKNANKYCKRLNVLGIESINLTWDGTDPCDLSDPDRLALSNEVD